jgi:hypothetical protein
VSAVAENIKRVRQGLQLETEPSRLLKDLLKYEALSKPLGKKKLEGIEAEKRKVLKQREAEDASIVKDRRELIDFLEAAQASAASKRGKKETGKTAKDTKAAKDAQPSTSTDSPTVAEVADYERLLSEILIAIEKHLSDQEELAAKLSESVEDIFKRQGLLVAV